MICAYRALFYISIIFFFYGNSSALASGYSELRWQVEVSKLGVNYNYFEMARPQGFYQLAGGEIESCSDSFHSINAGGGYKGGDLSTWLLDGAHYPSWSEIKGRHVGALGLPKLEYARVDLDRDGDYEFAYRSTAILDGSVSQNISIFNKSMHEDKAVLSGVADECARASGGKCEDSSSKILFLMLSGRSRNSEWEPVISAMVDNAFSDVNSKRLLLDSARAGVPNIGYPFGYLDIILNSGGADLILAPGSNSGVPELLVFSLVKDGGAGLVCVLVPKAWN